MGGPSTDADPPRDSRAVAPRTRAYAPPRRFFLLHTDPGGTRYVGDTLCDATTRKPARKTSRHHPAAVPVRPGAEAGRVGAIGVNILAHERPSWPVESLVTPGAHWSRLMSTGAGLERACTPRTWHTRDARPISDAPLASLTPYTSVPGAPVGPPCEAGPWSSTHKRRRISVSCAGMGPRGARIEQL